MRRRLLILLTIGWLVVACSYISLVVKANEPVVRAVLFWSESCPHCHEVIENVLPGIQAKYGDQLEIASIAISDPAPYEVYLAAVDLFDVPPTRQGVPALYIGDTHLVGSREIPEKLDGLLMAGRWMECPIAILPLLFPLHHGA